MNDARVVLASRPSGEPGPEHFRIVEEPFRPLTPGRVRLRSIYTSVDPAMRIRMRAGKSYIPPFEIGETVGTYSVGEVIESASDRWRVGDFATCYAGWQLYPVTQEDALLPITPVAGIPLSAYLGVLGFTGFTAWLGLEDIGRPQPGETMLVTAASGAVGSIAGQLARRRGARVVGVTSGAERMAALTGRFGFDAALDRTAPDFAEALDAACPDGIDVFFENAGGFVQPLVFQRMRMKGRVAMCGMIAQYNDAAPDPGPNLMAVVTGRLRVEGFIASDSIDRLGHYQAEATSLVRDGHLIADETVVDGLDSGPSAFARLLTGDKLGKLSIRLSEDPFAI
jgi:NADPH-dependent curcumin reductase CurA